MNPEVVIIPFLFGIPALVMITRMLISHKEKMAGLASGTAPGLSAVDARLARLEQAVESIAIEIERVGEGQRFVTKVLADRTTSPPAALPAPPITPS